MKIKTIFVVAFTRSSQPLQAAPSTGDSIVGWGTAINYFYDPSRHTHIVPMSIIHRFFVENIEENDIVLTSEMEHVFSTSTSLYDVLTMKSRQRYFIRERHMKYMLTMSNYI